MMTVVVTILSLVFAIVAICYARKYLYLYRNLHTNFKSFVNFVDTNYIRKDDVLLHNATVQALEMAREKNRVFEIKAYTKLLQRLKEGA